MSKVRRAPVALILVLALLAAAAAGRLVRQAAEGPDQRPPVAQQVASTEPDRTSAVAAALEHLRVLGSAEMYDSASRRRLLSAKVDAATYQKLEQAFDYAGETLGVGGEARADGELVSRLVPVGHRVEAFSPDRAVVAVWTVGILGVAGETSRVPVQATWSTERLTLQWREGAWRWIGLEHEAGPVPVGSPQVPSPAAVVAAAARDFEEPQHVG